MPRGEMKMPALQTEQKEMDINQVLKVQNFLIDLEKCIGQGQYGKVYIATQQDGLITPPMDNDTYRSNICACKIVEREQLTKQKENLIISEITNQEMIRSKNVVRLRRAIKTEKRYFIFMDFCNCSDLKELMTVNSSVVKSIVV